MPKITITTVDQYEAALKEIDALTGALVGSTEERRQFDLIESADAWDRGKGGEAAGETPDVPIQDPSR